MSVAYDVVKVCELEAMPGMRWVLAKTFFPSGASVAIHYFEYEMEARECLEKILSCLE